MHQKKSGSWLSRNWKWVVPLGCLGAVAVFAAFTVSIVFLVFGVMKSSDVYKDAVAQASPHALVVEALGEPVEPGWYLSGTINVNGSSGDADIAIPISGPRGSGQIYAVATKSAGRWEYEILEVEIDGQPERIDLLSP